MMSSGIAEREADWEYASPTTYLSLSLSSHTPLSPSLSILTHASSPEPSTPIFTPPPYRHSPHLPLPINPDLSHEEEEAVEVEKGGSSFNH